MNHYDKVKQVLIMNHIIAEKQYVGMYHHVQVTHDIRVRLIDEV